MVGSSSCGKMMFRIDLFIERAVLVDSKLWKVEDGFGWVLMELMVLAPRLTNEFWIEMDVIATSMTKSWCIGGDFNTLKEIGDSFGGAQTNRCMRRFNLCAPVFAVRDPPWSNVQFTTPDWPSS